MIPSAPTDLEPLTALATVYLALSAPAAALKTLHATLALAPSPAEVPRLRAAIVQAQADACDLFGAWANARDYLHTAAPDDAFAPSCSAPDTSPPR